MVQLMVSPLRAAGYARVSVLHEDSTSIKQQSDLIKKRCKIEGWKYNPDVDLYLDEGLSGSKKEVRRPAFERLLANSGKYDRIVVFRFDRLSRRMSELASTIEALNEADIAVISVNEGFGTDTEQGRVMANIMGSLAAGETEAIRQRVKSTQAKMFQDGKWKGGARPYGWQQSKLPGGGVRLVLKEDEAAVVKKAVKMIIKGSTIGGTARALNNAGHLTYKGNPFSPQVVSTIMRSRLLLGQHVVNKAIAYNEHGQPLTPHEALITLEEWNELQGALSRLRVVRPRKGGTLLAGVGYCGLCGGRMTGASTVSNPQANYRCRYKYALLNNARCATGVTIKAVAIDELVSLAILEVLKETRNIQAAGQRLSKDHAEIVSQRKKLENEFRDAKQVQENFRNQMISGNYNYRGGAQHYERDFALSTARFVKASDALEAIEDVPENLPNLTPWTNAKRIEQKWNRASMTEKNKVLRVLVDKVIVHPPTGKWSGRGLDPGRVEIVWRVHKSETSSPASRTPKKLKKKQRS
jgi:DNA invertase Pin-like site-specific DNA recombinase